MFYTYVLECVDTNKNRTEFYVGVTENVDERIIQHRSKSTQTTQSFDKITLVYYEACLNKKDAFKREKQLKTGFGKGIHKKTNSKLSERKAGVVHR